MNVNTHEWLNYSVLLGFQAIFKQKISIDNKQQNFWGTIYLILKEKNKMNFLWTKTAYLLTLNAK